MAALTLSFVLLVPARCRQERARRIGQEKPRARRAAQPSSTSPPTACDPTWSTGTPGRRHAHDEAPHAQGVKGQNGLLQGFPPNTGVGWYTLSTGTWPASTARRTTPSTGPVRATSTTPRALPPPASSRLTTSGSRPSAAGRPSCRWSGSGRATSSPPAGPGRRLPDLFGGRGIMLNYDLPGQPAGANAFGVEYQRVTLADAAGWTNVPASFSPAKQASFTHNDAQSPRTGLGPLHLRLDERRHDQLRPRAGRPAATPRTAPRPSRTSLRATGRTPS